MEAEKGTAWSLEFGAWSLEFGAWSLELGVWSLKLGAWSLDGVCHATGEGRWAGSMGAPGIRDRARGGSQRRWITCAIKMYGNRFHHCTPPGGVGQDHVCAIFADSAL